MKVIIGNLGLDGHELGAIVVARAFERAGHEVVYLGLCETPESIAATSVEEDADLIALGSMSGAHLTLIPEVLRMLKEKGIQTPVIAGGIIPPQDARLLGELGVRGVFPPGSLTQEIVSFAENLCTPER